MHLNLYNSNKIKVTQEGLGKEVEVDLVEVETTSKEITVDGITLLVVGNQVEVNNNNPNKVSHNNSSNTKLLLLTMMFRVIINKTNNKTNNINMNNLYKTNNFKLFLLVS